MNEKEQKPTMESTFKSMDTEEFIDIHFYRPIGYHWALLFHKLGVTPNAITVAAIFLGIAAGICFYFPDLRINIVGMLLLIWGNTYDSADGQLARMTKQSSPLGRILDGACGDIWFFTIYAAICIRLTPQWGIWIWVLGAITGYFHTKQASMADYYRNVHLLFLKGKSGSELSWSANVKENYEHLSWKKDFIYKFFEMFYLNYTKEQEKWSPKFQQMMKVIREDYDDEAPEWFRKAFRAKSLPLMKYTNMLSFNTRVIALFISLFLNMPWLYFVFELTVLNSMLFYMVRTHERFSEEFTKELIKKKNMIKKEQVKGIIFDYGGTIDSNGEHWAEVIWKGYRDAVVRIDKAHFREAYVYAERAMATTPLIRPEFNFLDMMAIKIHLQLEYLEEKGLLPDDCPLDDTARRTIAVFCYEYAWVATDNARGLISRLARQYPLVLVSNFYGNIESVLEDFRLDKYFQTIIESAVVGIRKPNPEIFQLGIDALELSPDNVVVIGDSYDKDILPSRYLGCQTIWIQKTGWTPYSGDETADWIIEDFQELAFLKK